MEKRTYGKSGIKVSVFGIGCWSYGGGDYWGPQSQKDINEVAQAALDNDINFSTRQRDTTLGEVKKPSRWH